MRLIFTSLFVMFAATAYADSGFPSTSYSNNNMPVNQQNNATTTPSVGGGDTFGSMVQTQTNQAMQAFQNVNYQKLAGSESQDDFASDDSSNDNATDNTNLFNLFPSPNATDNSGNN